MENRIDIKTMISNTNGMRNSELPAAISLEYAEIIALKQMQTMTESAIIKQLQ